MTRDEQKGITGFIEQTVRPVPPAPLDVEADAIIRALFVRNPEAAYRMTLLAISQAEEIARLRSSLHAERTSFRSNWLSRLLKKPDPHARSRRRDPRLSIFPQNIRSR